MDTEVIDMHKVDKFTRGDIVSFDDEDETVYGIVQRVDYDHDYAPDYISGMEVITEHGGTIWFVGEEIDAGFVEWEAKEAVPEAILEHLYTMLY